jgi:nucleoside-diphosphate-sugar epimerase
MVNEDSAPQPALAEYGNSKAQMQSECIKFARQNPQMRVSVVAPGAVYGPRGGLFCQTPFQTAKAGHFAWFEGGSGICNYVHVANLVDLAILAAQKDEASGQVFIAVDGQASWREFLMPLVLPWLEKIPDVSMAEVRRLAGLTTRDGSIKDVARAALTSPALMAALSNHPLLGKVKQWVTQRFPSRVQVVQRLRPAPEMILKPKVTDSTGVALWMADIYGPGGVQFDPSKARKILGWQSLVSLADGMEESLAWLRQVEISED